MFQFTHPCGCDPSTWVRIGFSASFQFTHPCGCDLPGPGRPALLGRFNSRTRVGATRRIRRRMQQEPVSIHAPVWVRHLWLVVCGIENKFQFTHPCGCDAREGAGFSCCTGFNSRTRVGATMGTNIPGGYHPVSIHAPVWVRHPITRELMTGLEFQFTHPCGCDIPLWYKAASKKGFNSRTRVGATG